MYGLLDADWNWRVEPKFSDITRQKDDPLALGIGDDEVVLIDDKGALIGEGKRYQRLGRVGKAFWSAQLPTKGYALLDVNGQQIATLTNEEANASDIYDNTLVYASGDTLKAYVPGRPDALTLGSRDIKPDQNEGGYLLFRDKAGNVAGLLTPKGAWLQGDSAPP